MVIWIILLVYLVILISLFIVFFIIKKHLKIILKEFQQYLDEIFFEVSKSLFDKKNSIVKFEEFINLFQQNKKEFFSKQKKDFKDYIDFWYKYRQDIAYFDDVVEDSVVSKDLIKKVQTIVKSFSIILKYYFFVRKFLCILTLGLFCLFK